MIWKRLVFKLKVVLWLPWFIFLPQPEKIQSDNRVISRHMLTPPIVATYAYSISFPCTLLQLE
jgi:hypothetical protein